MRRVVLLSLLVIGVVPATALAVRMAPGDGMLSVDGGRGVVAVYARGAMIGRLDRGTIHIVDRTPGDTSDPIVWGADTERVRGRTTVYAGTDLRFRLIGGAYMVTVRGIGIDISAVGRGVVLLHGDDRFTDTGVYSLTGDDCRFARASCTPLPDRPTRLQLRGSERERQRPEEKSTSRAVLP